MWGLIKKHLFLVAFLAVAGVGIGLIVIYQINKARGKSFVVRRTDLVESLSFSGHIDAEEKSTMLFQTTGKLAFIKVKDGDNVKKGQLLAGLDTGELWAAERSAYYKYLAADANAKYIEDTVKDHDKDESYLQKNNRVAAQTDRDIKYDAWLTAKRQLSYANLYSPISGIVYDSNDASPGEFVTATNLVQFNIVNPQTIYFSANADQTDVVRIKVGQVSTLTLDSFPQSHFEALVSKIAFTPRTDETGTVYEVKLTIPKELDKLQLRMGMTGDVNFVVNEKNGVLAIPSKYLRKNNGGESVRKLINGKIQITEVKIGETIEGQVEILSGLSEGDTIYDQTL